MQTAGGSFAGAITNQDLIVDYKITIGFPGAVQSSYQDVTRSVVSIGVDRSVTTSLPDQATLIAGTPSAKATIVLSGLLNQSAGVPLDATQTIYWLMNPSDPTSPMYRTTKGGLSVTIQAGIWDGGTSADMVTIFTGTVDTSQCSNGTVTLACRDQRTTVTNQATLPPVITTAPYNSGLTSEFAVDYLLRHSSPEQYYSWPAQRANCKLAVGFRSSLWADVGDLLVFDPLFTTLPVFTDGVYGTALYYSTGLAAPAWNLDTPILSTDTGIFAEFYTIPTAGCEVGFDINDVGSGFLAINLGLSISQTGGITVEANTASGNRSSTWATTVTVGVKHYVRCQWSWPAGSTSVTGTLELDGVTHAFSFTAASVRPAASLQVVTVGGNGNTIEGLQVTTETAGTSNNGFVPTLILDPSLNPLTALPDVTGKDVWAVLQDIAAAEAAVVGFDELGVCRFTNRDTVAASAVVRSVTSTTSLVSLDSLEQMSLVATHVQIPVSPLAIQPADWVWQMSAVQSVPANGTLTIFATTNDPILAVTTSDSGFFPISPAVATPGLAYWRGCTTSDGLGAAVLTGISFTVRQLSARSFKIVLTNVNAFDVWMVNPTGYAPGDVGAAAVSLGGMAVTGAQVGLDGSSSSSAQVADSQWPPGNAQANTTFGEINLTLPTNDWVQDQVSAQTLSDDLISDLHYPKTLYRNVSIIADPRLQALDRVTLVDSDVSQTNDDARLLGLQIRLSAGEWTQSVNALALAPPGAWLLGVAGRSELGSTAYLV